MSLVSKIVRLANSSQGRRTIEQARTRLDTPQNRQRLMDAVGKVRSRAGAAPRDPQAPPRTGT